MADLTPEGARDGGGPAASTSANGRRRQDALADAMTGLAQRFGAPGVPANDPGSGGRGRLVRAPRSLRAAERSRQRLGSRTGDLGAGRRA